MWIEIEPSRKLDRGFSKINQFAGYTERFLIQDAWEYGYYTST